MVDDWVTHTPKSVLAKNFGLNESVFANVPAADPYIINGTVTTTPPSEVGLSGNNSYVFHNSGGKAAVNVPGGAGNLSIIDSRNFPISTTIAAAVISLEPKGLRELHWHPNVSRSYLGK
jgi:oxalate decarboxylase/phosphoglucose isomerase-like protein (cupin superfamily)